MTGRVKGLIVALEKDVREDEIEGLIVTLKHIRGISSVTPSLTTPDDYINREQIRAQIRALLWVALDAADER